MRWTLVAIGPVAAAAAIWIGNTSLFSDYPADSRLRLIAHRGQHQLFDRQNLRSDTCAASRMLPPTHPFLENTIPSMQAAFAAGAIPPFASRPSLSMEGRSRRRRRKPVSRALRVSAPPTPRPAFWTI